MTTIDIPIRVLKAIALFCSTDEIRPAMCCISIEPDGNDGSWIVATDGHALAAYWLDAVIDRPILIDKYSIRHLLNEKPNKVIDYVTLSCVDDGRLQIKYIDLTLTIKEVTDERFVDWRPVIPNNAGSSFGEMAQFDSKEIARFAKASSTLSLQGRPVIYSTGIKRAAIVLLNDTRFIGLIMPFDADDARRDVYEKSIYVKKFVV